MADILGSVKQYFVTKETSLDNGVFKLFSKGSVAVCLLGSLLCAASQVSFCCRHLKKEFKVTTNCCRSFPGMEQFGYYKHEYYIQCRVDKCNNR